MQRFLRVFIFLSLFIFSYQLSAQSDVIVTVFEDVNGDGFDGGTTIGGLAAELTLYEDADGSGTGDGGEETGIVAVEGATGVYTFTIPVPGAFNYIVEINDQAPAYYPTRQVAVNPDPTVFDNDSDLDIISLQTPDFTVVDGINQINVDLGLVAPATVGDLVWEDFDGNGSFDGPDAGFDWNAEGIMINLTSVLGYTNDLLGNPIAAVNGGGGVYEFQNLPPDTYTVEFTQIVNNWYRTVDGFDSTPDQATGFTMSFVLESGMTNNDQDAGYMQPAKISDFVWEDLNGDGVQDGGEPGVDFVAEGITIDITLAGGAAATDLDGNSPPLLTDLGGGMYEFDNLAPGDYEVTFGEIAMMWYISMQNTTGVDTDSDPDPTTGVADNGGAGYTLMSGDTNEDVDAGYVQPAKISDFVWEDQNGDGVQDGGEPGLDGVDIMITDDLGGGVTDLDGNAVITSTSTGGGLYEFLLLPPGDYILTVNTNVLTDYFLSLQDQAGAPGDAGDAGNDSDADQVTGETHIVEIESDEQQEDIDFGYFRSGTIEGRVFHDSDGNGQDGTGADAPYAGMTVQLATAAGVTPVPDVFGALIPDQISDGAGIVIFNDVPPGDYILLYNLTNPWEFTYQDQSGFSTDANDVNNDSDVAMGGGNQTHTITLEGGEIDNTASAGIYKRMSLGDFIWIDDNGGDGIFDGTEGGAVNVIIRLLYDEDFDGIPETLLGDVVTDMSGNYLFENLIPGYYQVVVSSVNFGSGGALEFFQNCDGGGSPFTDNDNDGTGDALAMDDIVTIVIELFCDDVSDLPGPDENLFIDFCFYFDCDASTAPDLSWENCQLSDDNPPICNLNLLDNYCGSMNTETSSGDQPNPLCPTGGGPHNSSWFAFVAGEAGFEMEVVPFNCTSVNGFTGIQAGVYTDCTFTDAIYCDPNCSTGPITVGGPGTELTPGETYYFFLDGCAGSVCDYEVNVLQGGTQFTIPNPTGLSCSIPDCGPVCPGSEITFTVEGLDIDIDYHWTIPSGAVLVGDGEQTGDQVITLTNEIILAFPDEGIYTVFLDYATNECNVTTGAFIDVEVVQPDPEDFGEFTVCEHNMPFDDGDTDLNGNTLVGWSSGPLTMPGIDITFTYVDPDGCTIEQIIDIIQIDNSPREDVNLAICESDLPYQYDQLTITGNGSGGYTNFIYTLVDTPAASGCDSFITLTTVVIEHELELDPECLLGGVQIRVNDEITFPTVPNQISYQWYQDDNMNGMFDSGEEVTDTDGFDDILSIEESGTYCVEVSVSHFIGEPGEANCIFTYCEEVIIEDLVPAIPVEVDWLTNPCGDSGAVEYMVTNEDDDAVEYYIWTIIDGNGSILGGGNFQVNTVMVDWLGGAGGTLCVKAHNSCGDSPELCIPIAPIGTPDVAFVGPDEACQDSTVVIAFTGSVSTSAVYDWDFGNGSTSAVEGPHDVVYTVPGNYYITLTVDDNGCVSDEVLDSIMIIERLPAPVFTCVSTPTSITLTWLEIPGATGYEITLLDGVAGVQTTPTTYEATGVTVSDFFEISVAATSDGACAIGNAGTASCFAQDCDEPVFTFSPTRDTICLTTDVGLDTIYLDILGGTATYTNSFVGPGIINEAEGVFDANEAGLGMHTIIYNYTGDDNCIFSRSIIMHVFEQPVAAFETNVDTICITDAFTVEYTGGTVGAEYLWDFGDGIDMAGAGVGPFDITYSTIGLKIITLTVLKEECTSETITKNVWVEAELPELIIECVTDATSINYSWNDIADEYEVIIDAVSQGIQTDAFWNISGLSPGTAVSIEVIAISPNQCPNSADAEDCSATNCPDLSVTIDQIDALLCIDASTLPINLTYVVVGGFMDGSGVAVWSGNGVDPVTGVFTPSTAAEGPQVITLNYSEGECDAAAVSIVFTVVNKPTATFDGVAAICEGTEITLNHTGVGGSGAAFTWTVTGATVVGANDQSSITLLYGDSGDYDVSLVVSRGGCDSEEEIQTITVDEMLLPPAIICADPNSTSITFQWGAVAGATEYEIIIDGVSQGTQTGTSFPILGLMPNDERTIIVIAISDNTCSNSSSQRLCQAIDCPDTEIVPNENSVSFCEGEMTTYDIDFVINGGFMDGSGVMTFNGPSTDALTGEVDIASLNPGDNTIYLDYSEGPCDTRDSVLITVIDLPVPTLDFDDIICVTDMVTVSYTGDVVPGAQLTIVPTGNPTSSGGLPGEAVYQWDTPGTYEMIATVLVGTCVISSDPYIITVEPELLDPVISCDPTTTSIVLSWDAVDCASMYIVTIGGVAEPAQSGTTFSIEDLEPETSVDITVEAISDCSCENSMVSDVCMTLPCTPIILDITNNTPDCITNLPTSIQLDVIFSGGVGGGAGSWTGDFISSDGIFDYESSGVGSHDVTYSYEESGCPYEVTESVIVFDSPVLTIDAVNLTCFDSNDGSISYAAIGGDGVYNITIDASLPDFPKSYMTDGTEINLAPGTYTISVIDGNFCMDEQVVTVSAPAQPSFTVIGPPSIVVGTFGDLALNLGTVNVDNITNITWYSETETLCDGPDCFGLTVSPSVNSLYCVDITLEGGCVVNNCLAVSSEFITLVNVSNVFSPNGDGSNDNMVIQTNNPDMVASYLRVFDRWGNMVFNLETPWQPFDDMNYPGWNGTYNGQELNPGVYVYVFEFIEEPGATPEVRVGDVTIVK